LTEIAPEQLHNEPGWERGWMLGQDILLSAQQQIATAGLIKKHC